MGTTINKYLLSFHWAQHAEIETIYLTQKELMADRSRFENEWEKSLGSLSKFGDFCDFCN